MKILKILRRNIILILVILLVFTGRNYIEFSQDEIIINNKYVLQIGNQQINRDDLVVYVISLDRTPERYKKIKQQLDKYNIKHVRFSAVDGYNLKFSGATGSFLGQDLKDGSAAFKYNQLYQVFCPTSTAEYVGNSAILARTLNAGEFGCYCSHVEIWHNIINTKQKYALVLEDDAVLLDNFMQSFNDLLNATPKEWDLIYLHLCEGIHLSKFYNNLNNSLIGKIRTNNGSISGTASYLISLQGAHKLFRHSRNFTLPIDNIMSNIINNEKLRVYKSVENFITTIDIGNMNSVISDMGQRNN